MPGSIRAGDVLAQRYRLDDLLSESGEGRFWHAHDTVLSRSVAVHIIANGDERAPGLLEAARSSAALVDRRILRVLDARDSGEVVYVVNEWGSGESLDITVASTGPMTPRDAAWLVSEVADTIARAHAAGLAHGRLTPENVLVDHNGEVRIIGFGVDAALHGLPPGRLDADVHDLAGLLYAAMTGRWAGTAASAVPAAPHEHGSLLRPRRVRAGIPRVLDGICDGVLTPDSPAHATKAVASARTDHDLSTARGIADALAEFVGDVPPRESGYGALEGTGAIGAVPPVAVSPPVASPAADMPTQAGMPAFDDDDGVGLLVPGAERPAPPPEFTQPPDRPLFAPDPPQGGPTRRARAGTTTTVTGVTPPHSSRAHTGSGSWPWDNSSHGSGTGSGLRRVEDDTEVPGRRWMRLALAIGVLALLAVGTVAALQLRSNDDPAAGDDDTTTQTPTRTRAVPLTDVVASDFDPQGAEPFEENPELAPLVVDGDPATAWRTVTYDQDLGPVGLKTGVGMMLDLGSAKVARSVRLTLPGGPTTVQVFRTADEPTTVDDLEPAAEGATTPDDAQLTLRLPDDEAAQYVVLWLTSLPEAPEGGFRGQVAEVVVAG